MDILQAAASLYPGTAWNLNVDAKGRRTLVQAVDNTPRVPVPDLATLDAIVAAHVPPPSLEDQVAALQAQVDSLMKA